MKKKAKTQTFWIIIYIGDGKVSYDKETLSDTRNKAIKSIVKIIDMYTWKELKRYGRRAIKIELPNDINHH